MDKEYKITFTTDYSDWKSLNSDIDPYLKSSLVCQKYKNKTVKLSEIPDFVAEVGECVITNDEIEIYNDYRE